MLCQGRQFATLLCVVCCVCAGCMNNGKTVSQLKSDKEKLLARVQDEKKRTENLEIQNRSLTQRLDEAEKQIAQSVDSRGQRFAEFKRPPALSTTNTNNAANSTTLVPLNFSGGNRSSTPALLNPPQTDPLPSSSGWVPKQPTRATTTPPP